MLNSNGKRLYSTVFSDEMGRSLNPPHKKVKVDDPPNDIRLNCWAGISYQRVTSLHLYKESLRTDRYQGILEEHKDELDKLNPGGYFFQHDKLKVIKVLKIG